MISLMNDARRKAGKPKLGFVNPVIYSMANTTGIFTRIGSTKDNNNNGCKLGSLHWFFLFCCSFVFQDTAMRRLEAWRPGVRI